MAQVFLSYDREDGAKARVIAQALERAGHFVWYDLHIKGGAEYGREIEQALEQSDAVVVLWSERSVVSAWVRDEAAAGRDKGCLIPVLIEPVSPPMGFRQYQNLNFSSWKGRGKPPRLQELLSSIEALGGSSAIQSVPKAAKPSAPSPRLRSPFLKWAVIGAAVMIVVVALSIFLQGRSGSGGVHTVAVTAADTAAGPLARDLLVKLSVLQGAKSESMRLLGQSPDADLTFEAASNDDKTRLGANLVLIAGKDREILWSKDFEQPSGTLADLKQQMAFTAGRVLGCALEGLDYRRGGLERQTLKLYLNSCAHLTEGTATVDDPRPLIPSLVEITKRAPDFAPAWGGLLITQIEAVAVLNAGSASDEASKEELRRSIAEARKHHPDLPEIRLAESSLLPGTAHWERMRLIDDAKRASPENPAVLMERSAQLRSVGRNLESIADAEHALAVDPLSPYAFNSYISALAYSGRIEAAREQLAKGERLWPGTAQTLDMQYRFHLRFGDPKEALRLGNSFGAGKGTELYLKARAEPTAANIEAMRQHLTGIVRNNSGILSAVAQSFGQFNLNDEIYQIVLAWRDYEGLAELGDIWFRPQLDGFRRDPRFMILAKRTGLVDYWRKSGKWPDFCEDPDLPYDCKAEAAKLS